MHLHNQKQQEQQPDRRTDNIISASPLADGLNRNKTASRVPFTGLVAATAAAGAAGTAAQYSACEFEWQWRAYLFEWLVYAGQY